MSQTAQLTINIEHVDLLSVSGKLDGAGLRLLQKHVDLLLEGGSRFLVTDLAQMARGLGAAGRTELPGVGQARRRRTARGPARVPSVALGQSWGFVEHRRAALSAPGDGDDLAASA
ncbi:MAG: hypothetical protein ACRDRK_06990 [Pseudonocardia sp.]